MARGDHIRARGREGWRHGIDVGDGTVICFAGAPEARGRRAVVTQCGWEDFAAGRRVHVVPQRAVFSPERIVERARRQLGRGGAATPFRDSAHFARWCRTDADAFGAADPLATLLGQHWIARPGRVAAKTLSTAWGLARRAAACGTLARGGRRGVGGTGRAR